MSEEDLGLIHQYLDGTGLSEEQEENLKLRMNTDPELNRLFEQEKLIRQGIEFNGFNTLKSELDKLEASLPDLDQEEPKGKILSMRIRYAAAAMLLLTIVSALIITNRRPSQNLQELAEAYLSEPLVINVLRSDENELSDLNKAIKAYGVGDYAKAEVAFDSLSLSGLLTGDELDQLNFYASLTVLGIREDYTNAIKKMVVIQDKDDRVRWYLALIYLVNEQNAEARTQLELIVNNPDKTNFYKRAEELLKKFPDS